MWVRRLVLRGFLAIAVIGCGLWTGQAEWCLAGQARSPRPPVRLGEAACELPAGAAGTTGHLLVAYRVAETGRVDQARAVYSVVTPASSRDRVAAALEACVRGWSYQPAVSSGRAVAEWLLAAFHFFEEGPADLPMVKLPGGRSIPVRHLETLRREKQALAMFLLAGPHYRMVKEPGVELRTDLPGEALETLIGSVRRARRSFEAAFPQARPEAEDAALTMHVFSRQEEFNQVVAFDELAVVHVPLAGQYTPDGRMVYLSAGGKPLALTARVVAHEITHHLVHQRLYAGRHAAPFWVSEGIAAYIENLGPTGGPPEAEVDLASLDRGLHTEEGFTWLADPDRYLRRISEVSGEGVQLPVADIMSGRGTEGHDRTLAYGLSWILVHYLMTGEGGAHREAFRSWVMSGQPDPRGQRLLESLGMSPGEVAERLEAHRRVLEQGSGRTAGGRRNVR